MKKILSLILFLCISFSIFAQHTVRATFYRPGENCGWHVAHKSEKIDYNKLKNHEIKWVALSRDMFTKYGYKLGDIIEVESDNPILQGIWVVMDKMGVNNKKAIDFLIAYEHKRFNTCKVKIKKYKK